MKGTFMSKILSTVKALVRRMYTGLARKDVEAHLHALQTMTEQFHLCELSCWKTASLFG
jgi:hypothetical protein